MTQTPRILTPASRRWTFALCCGACATIPFLRELQIAGSPPPQAYLQDVVVPLLVVMLPGVAARDLSMWVSRALTAPHGDAAASKPALGTRVALGVGEWIAYGALMGALFYFTYPYMGHSCTGRSGMAEVGLYLGLTLWPAAALVTAVAEWLCRR